MENYKKNELISLIKTYIPKQEIQMVNKALDFSIHAHDKQKRISGEPYIHHPIEVSKLLANVKLDTSSIIAGLLHDTLEDTKITSNEIRDIFGNEVSDLVLGISLQEMAGF